MGSKNRVTVEAWEESEVWRKLHAMPDWPDEFRVKVRVIHRSAHGKVWDCGEPTRRLMRVARDRGYSYESRYDMDNLCHVLRFEKQQLQG